MTFGYVRKNKIGRVTRAIENSGTSMRGTRGMKITMWGILHGNISANAGWGNKSGRAIAIIVRLSVWVGYDCFIVTAVRKSS